MDPLYIEQLLLHREALAARLGHTPSLVEVLSGAIAAYRPTARAVPLPHVLVLRRCRGEDHAFVDSLWGPLPVDASDGARMRQSGPPVDLDSPLAAQARATETAPAQAEEQTEAQTEQATGPARGPAAPGRGLRAHDLRLLLARQGGHCAAHGCRKLASVPHHLDPWGVTRCHDLGRIALICRDHHDLVHMGFIENPADMPERWRVRVTPAAGEPASPLRESIDGRFRDFLEAPARRDDQLARTLAPEDNGSSVGEGTVHEGSRS
jgi:hypothetical protein